MIPYASRTGTRRNLAAMRAADWRIMVSARGPLRPEGFRYVVECGAWTAYQEWIAQKRPENLLDVPAFEKAVAVVGPGAEWIGLPDIVLGGQASLDLSMHWLRRLRRRKALAGVGFMIAVQNGMEADPMLRRVRRALSPRVGVFIGGDTAWKEATLEFWAKLAHRRGAICHVGRVNTVRRIRLCAIAGVDSFDGTSVSRYADTLPPLDAARRQPDLYDHRRIA